MKKIFLILILFSTSVIRGQEVITLTTPITKPNQTNIHIQRIIVDIDALSVMVQWVGNDNTPGSAVYPTPAILNPLGMLQPSGASLISTINKTNNTVNSIVKKIIVQLQSDGYIPAGSISGTPQ